MKKAFPLMASMLCMTLPAFAQTAAVQTTGRVAIINNMQSSTVSIESSTCGTTTTCAIGNSAIAGGTSTETITTKSSSSGYWNQDWGGYVGSTHYACHFNISIDSQFTAGACHHITATASQKAGPGGSHPTCSAQFADPTLADCSNGSVTFTIAQ